METKIKLIILTSVLLLLNTSFYAQIISTEGVHYKKQADSAFGASNFSLAASLYIKEFASQTNKSVKIDAALSAAKSYILADQNENAIDYLYKALGLGFNKKYQILKDSIYQKRDLGQRWAAFLKDIEYAGRKMSNPRKARFHTEDISLFWQAYDMAKMDTANRKKIYTDYYFLKASEGLQDYYIARIQSVNDFVVNLDRHQKFYASIRENTYKASAFEKQFKSSFNKLKSFIKKRIFQMCISLSDVLILQERLTIQDY